MKLDGILPFARSLLEKNVRAGDTVIDCTLGNGHDALFLAGLVGVHGKVYGFDIQAEAIQSAGSRIAAHGYSDRTILFHTGHEHLEKRIPAHESGKITGAIFNLGYLPGGDKNVVTKPKTTISAIKQLLKLLSPGGIIVLVVYHGHKAGEIERDELIRYVRSINQMDAHVLQYQFINQKNNPPFILAIEKRDKSTGIRN